jgi:hypothetical protein
MTSYFVTAKERQQLWQSAFSIQRSFAGDLYPVVYQDDEFWTFYAGLR